MRYSKHQVQKPVPKTRVNPVWRGIGCILFLITPIMAFAVSNVVLEAGLIQRYIEIPRSLRAAWTIPGTETVIPFFLASLALAVTATIVLYTIFFVAYAAMYKVVGPSPYGPTDVPPIRSNRRVRKSR